MQSNSLSVRLYDLLRERKVVYIYLPLIIYWVVLFILTSTPMDEIPRLFNAQDKFEHFLGYFVLSVLLCLTLHFQRKNIKLSNHAFLIALLLVLFYGAIDEVHQFLIPGRTPDITDWIADSLGAGCGILLCRWMIKANFSKTGDKLLPY